MSRRCKPGQRARVTHSGAIVLVVGHYFHGMEWGGTDNWFIDFFPWKVVSLGAPIQIIDADTGELRRKSMHCVYDDKHLEPLEDDDDGLTRSTEKDKPAEAPRAQAVQGSAP